MTDGPPPTSGQATGPASLLHSPFAGHAAGVRPNRAGQVGVRIEAGTLSSVTLIASWTSGQDGLLQAMAALFGPDLPLHTGHTRLTELGLLLRTGPLEFMLVGPQGSADRVPMLRRAIASDIGAVTDLSHARCRIRIGGAQCRTVLNKLFALDLREASLPVGHAALSGTHHVPCMLHRLGTDAFDVYVFSSYAHDQLATLLDAALEYGVALQPV